MFVTLAEETPVSEVIDTAFAIEDRAGVALGPVVVNQRFAPLSTTRSMSHSTREDVQPIRVGPGSATTSSVRPSSVPNAPRCKREQVERLRDALPLPQIQLPFVFTPDITRPQLDVLATALAAGIEHL